MPGGFAEGLKRFILWDYPRAGWQYDLMVGLILAFIFLTPRDWFRDQPRSSSVVMLPAATGASVFWIEPELLDPVPEAGRQARAAELVKSRTGRSVSVIWLEPIFNSEQETKGYMAYTHP
jgi:hypothetical protein